MCLRQGLPLFVLTAALICTHGARGEEKAHADANGDLLPERVGGMFRDGRRLIGW